MRTKEALKDNIQSKLSSLPLPKALKLKNEYSIIVTGIGGTGVVTIGALLGMAAHIENKEVTVLDQIGLAQKGGAVISHIKMAEENDKIFSSLINEASCNLLLGTDLVVSASKEVRDLISSKNTFSIINDNETPLSQFVLNPDFTLNHSLNKRLVDNNSFNSDFLNTSEIAESIFGNNIYSNIFQVGYAFQKGLIPIQAKSFLKALELNNVKVNENINAFNWGRIAAHDIKFLLNKLDMKYNVKKNPNIDELINFKYEELIKYQNKKYADTFLRKIIDTKRNYRNLKSRIILI